jgi:hypothetical protein
VAVVAASLVEPATVGKVFEVSDGDDPIDVALRSL